MDIDRRENKRKALYTEAILREDGHCCCSATISNISTSGFVGKAQKFVCAGQRLNVEFKGVGEVCGSVVWTKGLKFGFEFDTEINLSDLSWPNLAETRLPGRYTDKKRYRHGNTNTDYEKPEKW